ncbi:MAG: tetratricopeptide repeat protein [Polyangiaceae bacterium]|nr:tetratricopeptide repeat protein [Polyangiaceae bacterium]
MKASAWAVLIAALTSATLAWAGPADDARARRLFQQGDVAYAEGRYDDALAAFEEAHRLSQRPRLLFNIGNALERLGKLREAAAALEKYLPHAKPTEKATLEKRIQNLRKRAPEPEVELEDTPEPAEPRDREQTPRPTPSPSDALDGRSSADTTLGWVLLGVGGAAAVTGTAFGIMALTARKDIDAGCRHSSGQTLCDASARDAVDRDQRYSLFADLGWGVGLAALGAGTYFMLTASSGERPTSARSFADVVVVTHGGAVRVGADF